MRSSYRSNTGLALVYDPYIKSLAELRMSRGYIILQHRRRDSPMTLKMATCDVCESFKTHYRENGVRKISPKYHHF